MIISIRPVLVLLAILTLSPSCQSPLSRPKVKLSQIYDGAAQREDIERTAVIVIPGIMGSKLVHDANDLIVWGAFTREAAHPKNPESARIFALPMKEGQPLTSLKDSVRQDGALESLKVTLFPAFSIAPKAYFQILMTLGAGGYRDETLTKPHMDESVVNYGNDHYNCFQFAYDWRRSNAENAALLGQFVRQKKAYIEAENLKRYGKRGRVKFNLVAHSMGGLVARYYLRYGEQGMPSSGEPKLNWSGATDIKKLIMIGSPNAGSIKALEQLVHGIGFGPFTFRYPPALIGTFPSVYELLPRVGLG